jgi:hypothetical protein
MNLRFRSRLQSATVFLDSRLSHRCVPKIWYAINNWTLSCTNLATSNTLLELPHGHLILVGFIDLFCREP